MKRLISLLAAATAVVMFALPSLAQSTYTWQLKCNKVPAFGVGTGANLCWMSNGQPNVCFEVPPNVFASCAGATPLSGSGVVPSDDLIFNGVNYGIANQIQVSINIGESPSGCMASATVTKSFDPSNPKISIKENVSLPATVKNFFGGKEVCPNANASMSFSLNTQ